MEITVKEFAKNHKVTVQAIRYQIKLGSLNYKIKLGVIVLNSKQKYNPRKGGNRK